MPELRNPVVASMDERSSHPYSSIAMSPNRKFAIVAGKDTLQLIKIVPGGITKVRLMRISQHFQTAAISPDGHKVQMRNIDEERRGSFVRDTFGLASKQAPASRSNMSTVNVVITDVAWSLSQRQNNLEDTLDKEDATTIDNTQNSYDVNHDSIIAAAGSNGVVVVWSARRSFFQRDESLVSSMPDWQPEAILSQHSRAVNRLAWHPSRPGFLLTASQDSTVKLWVRQASTFQVPPNHAHPPQGIRSWFRLSSTQSMDRRSFTWQCRTTFEPKSEAVRDVRWSPFRNDIFAIVTVSGSLILYDMNVPGRAIIKISAHAGDATTLDWHPNRPYIIATGGSNDRCVKVWDLESMFSMENEETGVLNNSSSMLFNNRTETSGTESSNETERSGYASSTIGSGSGQIAVRTLNSSNKSSSVTMLHMLTVSATVTRLRWRPPAAKIFSLNDENLHDSMLAVATAPIKGASAGGSGVLNLWSYHRPYMPLSVLEGHQEGAVTDFHWIDTPKSKIELKLSSNLQSSTKANFDSTRARKVHVRGVSPDNQTHPSVRPSRTEMGAIRYENANSDEKGQSDNSNSFIWQHVLSVGRDGRCLLQSFARGDRPISRVPPSCFSMANYSPFQRGYGSLQIFSVHQEVPAGPKNELYLAGLRQDAVTAQSPGVFRELPPVEEESEMEAANKGESIAGKRIPECVPKLIFNVVDEGKLDQENKPASCVQEAIVIAPEVVHLSRFSKSYKFYPDIECPTRVELCLHNSKVAGRLRCDSLARKWSIIASMLNGSGQDTLVQKESFPKNAMQFILLPTLRTLLDELANSGDVQTCVALCEVLQVIQPNQTTRIPGLDIQIVREWYLSYIDLLRDMCLFSASTSLIRNCKDPFIGALNQQSTSIYESCPSCGKPLQPSETLDGSASNREAIARRACKTCRRRVGLCFLCHQPVKGMFVWCSGCGHGGHLDCALQWFGGLSGQPIREMCPTGCGHKCNLSQPLSAFPRTDSLANSD